MMHYTLATEDKNREGIRSILDQYFEGYSLTPCQGRWKGQHEDGLTISIVGNVDPNTIQQAAEEIKAVNQQDAVMVIASPCELTLI